LRGIKTNFGNLDSGWLRLQIPEIEFDGEVVGYSGDSVTAAARNSHSSFEALVGLPLLRMMKYGGNSRAFWIRK
jgi:hypothetical protein